MYVHMFVENPISVLELLSWSTCRVYFSEWGSTGEGALRISINIAG
jgi:hypothetical protein